MEFCPKVSIVVPVYNGANYMRQAIDSALSQTYHNIEVIVVNDGSSDNGETAAIAKTYGNRIQYLEKENGGCASALNFGIQTMRGDYFSWLSHDDVYLPEKIECQIRLLCSLSDRTTILYGGYELIDSESRPITSVRPDAVHSTDKLNIPLFPLMRGLLHGCSMLVPSRYFREVGVFDESLPSTQDYALWFQFLRAAPIYYDSRILIKSRVHAEQGTHKVAKHIDECNELWSGFLKKLTTDEMVRMEDTPYRFLSKTATFLSKTPYNRAQRMAASMAEDALKATIVSVIIPFFNRIDLTIEAVESVRAQTHQSFEVILVDDGSTDDLKPLQELMLGDDRIKYVSQERGGPAKARNVGVALAKGQYIAFLDSDDLWYPNKLAEQLSFMEENDLSLSHTSYERIDLRGGVINSVSSGKFAGSVFPAIIAGCPIAMPTVMGLSSLLKRNPFPEEFEIGEDVCLWISLTSEVQLGGVDKVLSKVRIGPDTAAFNSRKQVIGLINIASYVVHQPSFFQHGEQVRSLLQLAGGCVTSGREEQKNSPPVELEHAVNFRVPSRAKKFFMHLRDHGVRATFRRVRWYFKWRYRSFMGSR